MQITYTQYFNVTGDEKCDVCDQHIDLKQPHFKIILCDQEIMDDGRVTIADEQYVHVHKQCVYSFRILDPEGN